MNWVKENTFLTVFIVIMLIGIGGLGYEVYSASSVYDEASEGYTKAAGEYNRLRHLVPFPNKQNLDAYDVQKEEAGKKITAFEADLATKEYPLESISPNNFQDQLKAAVTAVRAKAAESGVKLPDKFYLGFDKYETTPPSNEAAGPLSRELKAIEWVMQQYLSHPATQLHDVAALARMDLPEETGGKGGKSGGQSGPGGAFGNSPPKGGGKSGPGGGGSGRRGLVQYHPFDVTIVCKQQALIDVLKAITSAQAPQFFVLRQIRITNSNGKGPPRVSPDAGKPEEKGTVQYIVGEEWIDVAARWEVVDFASPSEKLGAESSDPALKSKSKSGSSKSKSAPGANPASKSTPAPEATPAAGATPAAAAALTPAAVATPATTLTPAATPATPATPAAAPAATPAAQPAPGAPQP